MAEHVTGDQYFELSGQLWEIDRQLRQPGGYPFVLNDLRNGLQVMIGGHFETKGQLREFATWRTTTISTHKNVSALRKVLKGSGCIVDNLANELFARPGFCLFSHQTELELVKVSVRDFGFDKGKRYYAICAKAKELGLQLCPAEVGPQLRLDYTDQPRGEWLVVAMEPIADSDGVLGVFYVGCSGDGERWLNTYDGDPGYVWYPDDVFVFCRRK